MPATYYTENNILNYLFGKTTYTPGDVLYFGLGNAQYTKSTSTPSGVEVSGTNYARVTYCNTRAAVTVTGVSIDTGTKVVTLTATTNCQIGESVTVAGVNTGWTVTGVDGTWTCISPTDSGHVVFTATNPSPNGTASGSGGTVTSNNWTTSTTATLHNHSTLTFAESGGTGWGTAYSIFICDHLSSSSANVLYYYNLAVPLVIPSGMIISYPAETIIAALTSG